ncbi:MAG: ATP-binding protein, partial [Draconibacterium sp.]|nr:ATP-binding protein [Draconibacterium sp.]
CYNLTIDNQDREINGLLEAMSYFDKQKGVLVTFNQEDLIVNKNKKIEVMPAYKFISELSRGE